MRLRLCLALAGILAASECNLVFGLNDYSVASSDSDAAVGEGGPGIESGNQEAAGPACNTNAECTEIFTKEGPIDSGITDGSHDAAVDAADASDGSTTILGFCVKPEHQCVRLLSPDCTGLVGDYTNDDAILVGTLFTLTGPTAATNVARQQSATLAVEEINSSLGSGGIPGPDGGTRPLVAVTCDESSNLTRVGTHLVNELHVAGIVGPNTSQDTLDITKISGVAGGSVIMTPTGVASSIASLSDNGLTWRDVPSDLQRAKLLVEQINEIETSLHATRGSALKLGVYYRNDALGQSTYASINGTLQWNGHGLFDASNSALVLPLAYDPLTVSDQTAKAAQMAAFHPDVVAVFGTSESVTNGIIPMEIALDADGGVTNKPWYVLIDSNKVAQLLAATSLPNVASDFRTRIRGTGVTVTSESAPVLASFTANYLARYGTSPASVSGTGPSYDAMYSIAYGLAASTAQGASGASVASGLNKLSTGGQKITVGPVQLLAAFGLLTKNESVSAIGTFGPLKWDSNGDILGGNVEIWCIGSTGQVAFGSSGLTMDVASQVINGSYTQCQ